MGELSQISRPPKVAMVTQHIAIGGMERMIIGLTLSLKRLSRCSPVVFAYDQVTGAGSNTLGPVLDGAGVESEVFKKENGFRWDVVTRLMRFVRHNGIEILHSHCIGSLIYCSIVKLLSGGRLRIIHTQHSFIHLKRKRRYQLYERVFTLFADAVTVVSPETRRTYIELGFPDRKIRLIENGISFLEKLNSRRERIAGRGRVLDRQQSEAAARLAQLCEAHWILYMARLHRQKGQDHAMELWRRLAPAVRQRTALIFVGPEASSEELKRIHEAHSCLPDRERVVFAGPTDNPESWLEVADSYLSCSESEGMPLGPLEAVGAGLPVVLSAIPGHEFLKDLSSQFPLGDWFAGASAVAAMLEETERKGDALYQDLWSRSRGLVGRFSIDTMAERYFSIYQEALATSGRAAAPGVRVA